MRYELAIEISKTQEGLNVLNLPGFRPILYHLNLVSSHGKTRRRKHIAQIFHCFSVKFTLLSLGIKAMLSKMPENLPDM